jgi:hypothetical protein
MRDTIFGRGRKNHFPSPVFKVPRQCPLVLPVEACMRKDGALGSEKLMFSTELLLNNVQNSFRTSQETYYIRYKAQPVNAV